MNKYAELGSYWFSSIPMWAENADENMQRKKQFAKFRMLQIEEDKHVYVIYIFATLPFRTEVIAPAGFWPRGQNQRRHYGNPRVIENMYGITRKNLESQVQGPQRICG